MNKKMLDIDLIHQSGKSDGIGQPYCAISFISRGCIRIRHVIPKI